MKVSPEITSTAALLGEGHRFAMLWALLDGRARTAGELALISDLSAQSASAHLAKLVEGGILSVEKQGRHRYYRIEDPAVAEAVEGISAVTARKPVERNAQRSRAPAELRFARSCYDHLAGQLGVAVLDALKHEGYLAAGEGRRLSVTQRGEQFFHSLGVDVGKLGIARRPLATCCLDWTERLHHLSGALGAALLKRFIELGWLLRFPRSRTLSLTPKGSEELRRHLPTVMGDQKTLSGLPPSLHGTIARV